MSGRGSKEQKGVESQRILDSPVYQEAFDSIRGRLIDKLEHTQLDGQEKTEQYVLELVRCLQANMRHKRMLNQTVNTGRVSLEAVEDKPEVA